MSDNLPAVSHGAVTYRASTDAAELCRQIVMATAKDIQGRKYVCVEGWQAIAIAHGCAATACNVERIDGGVRATGQVRRMDSGVVIAEAEGFVGEDEAVWFGGEITDRYGKKKTLPKRADFAIRAMAQTRAVSRACRSAFAHVVVMIDRDLGTTPAEEMYGVVAHGEEVGGAPGSAGAGTQFRDIKDVHGNPHVAAQTEARQSSANGRKMAADDPHLVDATRKKGETTDAPKPTDKAAQWAKTWTDMALQNFTLVKPTNEWLAQWWEANDFEGKNEQNKRAPIAILRENFPDDLERLAIAWENAKAEAANRGAA